MNVEVLPGWNVPTGLRAKPFFPGETFEVDDKEARRLISMGVVKEVAEAGAGGSKSQLNVGDTVKLILEVVNLEELKKFEENETRKGVLDAVQKRRAELMAPAE